MSERYVAVDDASWREACERAKPGDVINVAEGYRPPSTFHREGVRVERAFTPEDIRVTTAADIFATMMRDTGAPLAEDFEEKVATMRAICAEPLTAEQARREMERHEELAREFAGLTTPKQMWQHMFHESRERERERQEPQVYENIFEQCAGIEARAQPPVPPSAKERKPMRTLSEAAQQALLNQVPNAIRDVIDRMRADGVSDEEIDWQAVEEMRAYFAPASKLTGPWPSLRKMTITDLDPSDLPRRAEEPPMPEREFVDGVSYWVRDPSCTDNAWRPALWSSADPATGWEDDRCRFYLPGTEVGVSPSDLAEIGPMIGTGPDDGERARIVAWLRAEALEFPEHSLSEQAFVSAADAIERGEHERPLG